MAGEKFTLPQVRQMIANGAIDRMANGVGVIDVTPVAPISQQPNNQVGQDIVIQFNTNGGATNVEVLFFDLYNAVATAFALSKFATTYSYGYTCSLITTGSEQTDLKLLGGDFAPSTRIQRFQSWAMFGGILTGATVTTGDNSQFKLNLYSANGAGSCVVKQQNVANAKRPFDNIYAFDWTQGGSTAGIQLNEFFGLGLVIPAGENISIQLTFAGKTGMSGNLQGVNQNL